MEVREGTVPFPFGGEDAQTWYRISGDLRPGDAEAPAPLVALHGGPGATHDYLLSLVDLANGRAVIHYDQLGGGRSTHYPDRGADFWTPELFVRELHNLVDALGMADRHHVLGQSWGGFLAEEYALTQPPGLRSLVLADTAASWADFAAEAGKLRAQLPEDVQATLAKHEEAGTYDDPESIDEVVELPDEKLGRPELRTAVRIVRAAPAAELVVVDDGAAVGEIDEREQVVVGRPRPAVEHDERWRLAGIPGTQVARDAVPRLRLLAAEREGDGALAHFHAAASLRSPA